MITTQGRAECSNCGQPHTLTVYRSINVAEDPALRDKVKDGSLFVWECPHCGKNNLARYETLYHDPERKLMVWVAPSGDVSETQMQAISNHTKAMGGYELRLAADSGDLIEKILIDEAGLDDVVVEICKYVLKMEMASKQGADPHSLASLPVHFYRLGDASGERFLTFIYPSGSQMSQINVGYNVYEDCCGILERNPQIKPGDGFQRIDASWVSKFFQL